MQAQMLKQAAPVLSGSFTLIAFWICLITFLSHTRGILEYKVVEWISSKNGLEDIVTMINTF